MNNLNEYGYSSPPKRSGVASDEKIQFYVEKPYPSNCWRVRESVIANKEDTLAYALQQNHPKMMKNIKKMLVWAEIRCHSGMKSVNPFLLPCGFIQPETTIQTEERSETIYEYNMHLENTKPYSKLRGCVFFISIENRRRLRAITKVHYTDLRCHNICVYAAPFQTYRKALERDQQFTNVSLFTVKQKQTGFTIDIDQKPVDFSKELTLHVQVKKSPPLRSRHSVFLAGVSTTKVQNPVIKSAKKNIFGKISGVLKTIYPFSKGKDNLKNDELPRCTSPEGLKKISEKSFPNVVQLQFSKNNAIRRPVRFSKALNRFYDSVGLLKCGTVIATCFLVKNDVIVTNWHVVNDIYSARRSSTPSDHSEVYVHFDYEGSNLTLENRHKLKNLNDNGNHLCEDLDYALLCLENPVERSQVKALGGVVRCAVPEQGQLCIVGHPNGDSKQDELCAILPLQDDLRESEVKRKFRENALHCINNPSGCAVIHEGQNCVHLYQSQLLELCRRTEIITYDVGFMGKGASGAPVFDMKCNIVALHTGGFTVGDGNSSIVEYGITFKAIIKHLQAATSARFVRDLFPNCLVEDMETDELYS